MRYIIALDQGTTSSRAVIFNAMGEKVFAVNHEFEQLYPQPGWVEHRPEDILNSQIRALKDAVEASGIDVNAIDAIGAEGSACLLANHGAVAVGKDMDTAFKVCTVLEMTAQIYYMARCIGKPMPIDAEKIAFMKEFVSKSYGQK